MNEVLVQALVRFVNLRKIKVDFVAVDVPAGGNGSESSETRFADKNIEKLDLQKHIDEALFSQVADFDRLRALWKFAVEPGWIGEAI